MPDDPIAPTVGTEVTLDAGAHRPAPAQPPTPLNRYRIGARLGQGGMGEVRRVYDARLDRHLAMKTLDPRLLHLAGPRARFLNEARITAGLQHPGIVAVHDQGERPDGALWYTMKEVRGQTLSAVIQGVHAASTRRWAAADGWSLRRLIEAFVRVCEAMAYAHAQGVIHRDLKPSNIMVGEFGEVLVVDWGLAIRAGLADPTASESPTDARMTQSGAVLGTIAYMPPEQARGELDALGPRSDVYALGGILFEILLGRPPLLDTTSGLHRLIDDRPPNIEQAERRPDSPAPPPALVQACAHAMAAEPGDRPNDAGALATRVRAWLDDSERRAQAVKIINKAKLLQPRGARLRAQAEALRSQAAALLEPIAAYAPVAQKAPGWALEDAAEEALVESRLADVEFVQTVRSALEQMPDLPEAHALLADYYRAQVIAAEGRHDRAAAAEAMSLLRGHDDGRYADWIAGRGRLCLTTDAAGARFSVARYETVDRRLQLGPFRSLGAAPVDTVLDRGSYMVRIEAPGCALVNLPVLIERETGWVQDEPVLLPPEDELGSDDVYVPAGWFIFGGDPAAPDPLPRQRLWLDGFIIRRHPVTVAEYSAFLQARCAVDGQEAIGRSLPANITARDGSELRWHADGRTPQGEPSDWPVAGVTWFAAREYARWLAQGDGRPWRLPHECEWEKAARGVDGRLFAWGDFMDATWARVFNSQAGGASRAGIRAFPTDVSPYGVFGLAGNTRDWCCNEYLRAGPEGPTVEDDADSMASDGYRVSKGGAYGAIGDHSRAAGRFGARPFDAFSTLGFRLARRWPVQS